MIMIDVANWNQDRVYARTLIEKTGLTQQQLADLLGLSRVQIGNYYGMKSTMPYCVQVCIQIIADQNTAQNGEMIRMARPAGRPARAATAVDNDPPSG